MLPARSTFASLVTVAAALSLTGCIERLITVTSQPAGALVYLNDEEVGRTPVTVPFRFYGVYDVRLEHEGDWMSESAAAAALGVSIDELRRRVEGEKLDARLENGQTQVLVYYKPLWTKQNAEAPWWEAPGPDLVAEATPNNRVELKWDFKLEPVGDASSETLLQRAKEMRSKLSEAPAPSAPPAAPTPAR